MTEQNGERINWAINRYYAIASCNEQNKYLPSDTLGKY